jgi:hypothetical protein
MDPLEYNDESVRHNITSTASDLPYHNFPQLRMAPSKHFPSIGNYSLHTDQNTKQDIVSCMVVNSER